MSKDDNFFISYKGKQVEVSTVLDGANIFFSVHLPTTVTIAERAIEDDWTWYDIYNGDTLLAEELGVLIEGVDV